MSNKNFSSMAASEIELSNLPFQGVVTDLIPNQNYGILVTVDGLEVYFLRASVLGNAFDSLEPGSRVRFDLSPSVLGLQAKHVALRNIHTTFH